MKILLILLVGFSISYAQIVSENQQNMNMLDTSRSALKVYLVNGISIAYMKEINSDWAWQLKFDADFNYEGYDLDRTQKSIYSDTSNTDYEYTHNSNEDDEGQSFAISFHYIYNFYKFRKFSSYFGAGPKLEYFRTRNTQKNKVEYNDGRIGYNWRETKINSFFFGASFVLGLEASILSYLSVIAEYELDINYGWHENKWTYIDTYNNKNINIYDGTRTQIELQNIKLGLILYL